MARRRRREARSSKPPSGRRPVPPRQAPRGSQAHGAKPLDSGSKSLLEGWLHLQAPGEPPWRLLPIVLAAALAIRAAVALAGDFVLHPDEIMQYLEPAHRLAFGNGVVYWEYFYGARSWLVPGAVAAALKLFALVGAAQPAGYIAGVKLGFCVLSLAIPAGMYFFARRHFGEPSARAALVAGACWYELAGFAHKPMTEFVATALLLALLALVARQAVDDGRSVWLSALVAVLASAVRVQYAPLAFGMLAVLFIRTRKRVQLVIAAAAFALAVGAFDAITWDGGLFHSYTTNVRFNLLWGEMRSGESPAYQYLEWLLLAGGGLSAIAAGAALLKPRRYGFLLLLAVLLLAMHSLQAHKEYRFVFAVIPIWLLIAADIWARFARHSGVRMGALAASAFAAVSATGIAGALPGQDTVYKAWSRESGVVAFVANHDPVFAAYRYLASASGVKAVWQVDRAYLSLPGYYYLHHDVPFYDQGTGLAMIGTDAGAIRASVSHIVTGDPSTRVPGYSLEQQFGGIRILRRDENGGEVRNWETRTPTIVHDLVESVMNQISSSSPTPPENAGIRFVDRDGPRGDPH